MPETNNISEQNAAVTDWFRATMTQIKTRYMQLIRSPERSGDGFESIRHRLYKTYGEIDRGAIRFDRYLIYRHKGAGKGYGGSKGSTWLDAKGQARRTNPASKGKMNTGSRQAAEWLNPVLDTEVPKLAEIVAGFKADQAIKQIQIK